MEYIEELRKRYPIWSGDREMEKDYMLTKSAATGQLDMVAYLLKQGANAQGERAVFQPYITNAPVVKACANGSSMAIIELLLQHGADAEVAVTTAANLGRKEVLQHLLNLGLSPTDALSKLHFGPFMDVVQVLLDAGVNPNEATAANSLLAKAIRLEHTALFKLLIKHGADLHAPGTAEECVRQANKDGLDSMLQLLQEHGVDITAIESSQQSTT
jgi:ankyrin repeat protein